MNKLHILQTKVGAIAKDATNPFYKSKYFDINSLIATIKPILNEVGLTILQPLGVTEGKSVLTTIILDSESGDQLASSAVILPDNLDPQKMGSAITYYRRYSLQSMLLLEAEDDDANSTVKQAAKPVSKTETAFNTANNINPQGNPQDLGSIIQCKCGGEIEKFEGISKKNNKAYTKLTCLSCGTVSWG